MMQRKKWPSLRKKTAACALALVFLLSGAAGAAAADGKAAGKTAEVQSLYITADLMDKSIAELQAELQSGRVTSKQLVRMYLDRIEAYDKELSLNAVISVNEDALSIAESLDQERAAGKVRGPLHGIPIVIKDNYDYEGMATSAGAVALKDSIAPDDAFVVSRLRAEGAIVLAKTNLSEVAMSGRNSRSTLGGAVHNAYDTTRTAAGSSGGTGVAVTANFAVAGLGTDTGSSVRAPSTMSNLYGIRPTYGLTSRDGVVPLNLDNDVTGPLCKSVGDLAIMLDVMAKTDPSDAITAKTDEKRPETYTAYLKDDGLKGKRIGVLQNSFGYTDGENPEKNVPLDATIAGLVDEMKADFEKGGAVFVDLSQALPDSKIKELRADTGTGDVFEWDLNQYLASLGPDAPMKSMWDIAQTGMNVGHMTSSIESAHNPETEPLSDPRAGEGFEKAVAKRAAFREAVEQIMDENDLDAVIYVPYTQPGNIEAESQKASFANPAGYTSYFGPVAGLPEMSVPMGLSKTSGEYPLPMPMGFNIFGRSYDEGTLIEIAAGYSAVSGGTRVPPNTTPALVDQALNACLAGLLDEIKKLDAEAYTSQSWGELSVALSAAEAVDTKDPGAAFEAALALAKAYDALALSPTSSSEAPASSSEPSSTPNSSSSGAPDASSSDGAHTGGSTPTGDDASMTVVFLALASASAGAAIYLYQRRKAPAAARRK